MITSTLDGACPKEVNGHFHYVDYPTFGERNPIYFSVVREIISKKRSTYYYKRRPDAEGLPAMKRKLGDR